MSTDGDAVASPTAASGAGVTRTAREVVELYNYRVWNERDTALAGELFGDSVVRHGVGGSRTLTHREAVARVEDHLATFETITFELPVIVAGDDGEHVAIVYDTTLTTTDGEPAQVGSMEVFRVVDGRIVEVWNCGREMGRWV